MYSADVVSAFPWVVIVFEGKLFNILRNRKLKMDIEYSHPSDKQLNIDK